MTREKKITETLPTQNEIDKVSREIAKREFLRLMILSDSVTRYVQIKLKYNVNWLQVIVLLYIITRGGIIIPSHLARLTLRSNYSMTRLIDEMVKEGLVVRIRGEQDRRTIMIKITKKGLYLMMENLNYIDLVQDSVLSCLTEDNIETLINLKRIIVPTLVEKTGKRPDDWSLYYRGIAYEYFERNKEALNEFNTSIKRSNSNSLIRLAKEAIKKYRKHDKNEDEN